MITLSTISKLQALHDYLKDKPVLLLVLLIVLPSVSSVDIPQALLKLAHLLAYLSDELKAIASKLQ